MLDVCLICVGVGLVNSDDLTFGYISVGFIVYAQWFVFILCIIEVFQKYGKLYENPHCCLVLQMTLDSRWLFDLVTDQRLPSLVHENVPTE